MSVQETMASEVGQSLAEGIRARSASTCGCTNKVAADSCPACSAATAPHPPPTAVYVYALGRIRPHIPNMGLEKELTQTMGRVFSNGPSDEEALIGILKSEEHRRFATEVCWTFAIDGVDAYVLKAQDSSSLSMILESLRPDKSATDTDVVIGRALGAVGFAECNGRVLPAIAPSQVYSYDRATIAQSIATPKGIATESMKSAVKQTLDVTGQLSGNMGVSPGQRAVNYAVTRSSQLYEVVATQLVDNWALGGMTSRPTSLSGSRSIIDVIFMFRHRVSGLVNKMFMRVDVTDLYPFQVSPIQPFFEAT